MREPLYLSLTLGAFALYPAAPMQRSRLEYRNGFTGAYGDYTHRHCVCPARLVVVGVHSASPSRALENCRPEPAAFGAMERGQAISGVSQQLAMSLYAGDLRSPDSSVLQQAPINLQGFGYRTVRAFDW